MVCADNVVAGRLYKTTKLEPGSDVKTNGQAALELEDDLDDIEAGPAMPPGDDQEDADGNDDEDGRFFGGGVSRNTTDVLDYIDQREGQENTVGVHPLHGHERNFDCRVGLREVRQVLAAEIGLEL